MFVGLVPGLTMSSFPEVSIVELTANRVDADVDVDVDYDDDNDDDEEEEMIPPPPQMKRRRMMSSPGSDDVTSQPDDATLNDDVGRIKTDDVSSKTSRLLTKNDCRATGGRKRNSGSLIHSIPKFSQVPML